MTAVVSAVQRLVAVRLTEVFKNVATRALCLGGTSLEWRARLGIEVGDDQGVDGSGYGVRSRDVAGLRLRPIEGVGVGAHESFAPRRVGKVGAESVSAESDPPLAALTQPRCCWPAPSSH